MSEKIGLPDAVVKIAEQMEEFLQEFKKPSDIRNLVKTFEDVEDILDIKFDFSNYHSENTIAQEKLILIFKILNEGWKPDWKNSSQKKWYPWFKMSPFGFVAAHCADWLANSGAGSRLCGKTDTIAEYAGRQFEYIYKDMLN